MSTVTSRSWMISAAVAVLIVLATTAGGETPQQPNQDTLGALLVEVRGLRSAIEQMASVGPSIQLAMVGCSFRSSASTRSSGEGTLCVTRSPGHISGPPNYGIVSEIFSERWKTALNLYTGQILRVSCRLLSRSWRV